MKPQDIQKQIKRLEKYKRDEAKLAEKAEKLGIPLPERLLEDLGITNPIAISPKGFSAAKKREKRDSRDKR